jgi:hypothetical protein
MATGLGVFSLVDLIRRLLKAGSRRCIRIDGREIEGVPGSEAAYRRARGAAA